MDETKQLLKDQIQFLKEQLAKSEAREKEFEAKERELLETIKIQASRELPPPKDSARGFRWWQRS